MIREEEKTVGVHMIDDDVTTKINFHSKVHGNYDGAVKINKPRRYRQYMNRKGGFNRPLDYIA
ncbi:unnamed protein product [Angiostrongylus costaricensis]|uniref:U4/U6.U5 small nuclear ribonucleoprotein 27 kDa protein n=1 Tax=Angiostrongylus costaricensis TaxID=334426 RepID=A0A0R3PJS7_ANGCS|nr:unnamed protein product [Angiostrongylus costaricensis]